MIIGFLSVLLMFIVAYSFMREGLATSFCMLCNVMLAGLIAFNFWEPIANQLDEMFAGGAMHGYEDLLSLGLLFALVLGLLRLATNWMLPQQVEFAPRLQQIGSIFVGLLTGYLLAGFMTCILQTVPWHERFMQFDPHIDGGGSKTRRWLPPDRVWLAMMHKASAVAFSQSGSPLFDENGSFELRYARHRRYTDDRDALPAVGEENP